MSLLGFAKSITPVCIWDTGVPKAFVLLLKVPLTTATERVDALLVLSGRVTANIHWIVPPTTLPLTEFTFSSVTVSTPLLRRALKNLTTPLAFAQM